MKRYEIINKKNKREIVLLKSKPCVWGKCSFCDYIEDNCTDDYEMDKLNRDILNNVTGIYSSLEVINSGSVFELTEVTLKRIKNIVESKNIKTLYFESYYGYKNKLEELRQYFQTNIVYKCGIETFDNDFRNNILNKNVHFGNPSEVAKYFDSICLMVGVKGQTKDMIERDIDYLTKYFRYGCINIYNNNSTNIEADFELIEWFKGKFKYLEENKYIDILWSNTDFGVGVSV